MSFDLGTNLRRRSRDIKAFNPMSFDLGTNLRRRSRDIKAFNPRFAWYIQRKAKALI